MTRNNRYAISLVLALAVIGAAAYYWRQSGDNRQAYRLAKVDRGSITAAVSATGTLNPVVSVQVGSQVSGQVQEINVDYNSQVKKDQLIARINPDSFMLRVNQAMADLDAARATVMTQRANVAVLQAELARTGINLADAQRDLDRNKMLIEKNFISKAVLDKAQAVFDATGQQVKSAQAQLAVGESQVRNGEAQVKQREAQLAQAKVDLDRTMIRAPVDGIVVKKSVEPGQTVAASLQAPELFVIAQDLREMQVETSIDEAEVGRVRVGQAATFTVDSFPGRTFSGMVSQVRKAAQVVQNVVTYIAVIATSNADLSLFPGMTANVRIIVDTRDNALRIPNAALRFRPAGASDARDAGAPSKDTKDKGSQGGQGSQGEAARERLTKELDLNAEQQAKVEVISNETRDKIRALGADDPAERRRQVERLRSESRARIAELLTPEQRARYEAMGAARRSAGVSSGRVWVLDAQGRPKAVAVRTGLTDGTYSEQVSGEVTEGVQLITGTVEQGKGKAQPAGGPRFGF
ncbi:MAG: HlyD family efflux transporter periplasmic adaptor subunit [Pseudomonadota bacterium]